MKALILTLILLLTGCATTETKKEDQIQEAEIVCQRPNNIVVAAEASLTSGNFGNELANTGECFIYAGRTLTIDIVGQVPGIFQGKLYRIAIVLLLTEDLEAYYSFMFFETEERTA